jgi:hypothetical protein
VNTVHKSRLRGRRIMIAASAPAGVAAYLAIKFVVALCASQPQYAPARVTAWEKITPRLHAADLAGQELAKQQRERVKAFFLERRHRTEEFGEAVLSMRGKWVFVKNKLGFGDADDHREFLRKQFEKIVVSGPELEELIHSAVESYINGLQGIENDLLVQIRADLSDGDLARFETGAMLRTEDAFRKEYAKSLEQAAAVVKRDVVIQVGREAVTWVGADIATSITISLTTAVAERLGVSAGILGTGAASGAVTLGVGIAAGFILDALLDQVMKAWGHNPAGQIALEVNHVLDKFENLLLDGDRDAVQTYETLRRLQNDDLFTFVRKECRRAFDAMDSGGYLGLSHELKRLQETRSRLREEALRKLILEGGQS